MAQPENLDKTPEGTSAVPSASAPSARLDRALRNQLLLSLLLSLVIIGVGIGWAWRIGQEAIHLDHELYHTQLDMKSLQNRVQNAKGH